jgi:hypothetical protein
MENMYHINEFLKMFQSPSAEIFGVCEKYGGFSSR